MSAENVNNLHLKYYREGSTLPETTNNDTVVFAAMEDTDFVGKSYGLKDVGTVIGATTNRPYLKDPTAGTVYIDDIVNAITCFRGDTTYITMADGSRKLLKDVKKGEVVLGWNVATASTCETVVVENRRTGKEFRYDTYFFSNGKTLDIYDNDYFMLEDTKLYNIKNILETQRNEGALFKSPFKTQLGNTYVLMCRRTCLEEPVERYSLYTSNNTYFANDILGCHRIYDYPNLLKKVHLYDSLPANIRAIYEESMAGVAIFDNALDIDNYGEHSELLKRYEQSILDEKRLKDHLASLDFYTNKFVEGKIGEHRWEEIVEQRDKDRAELETVQTTKALAEAEIALTCPYILPNWGDERYNEATWNGMANLNAHLNDFKQWLQ